MAIACLLPVINRENQLALLLYPPFEFLRSWEIKLPCPLCFSKVEPSPRYYATLV
jgi:hypothetical protein